MKYLLLILCFIIITPVFGQRKAKDEIVTPSFVEGVVYSLPRSGVRVQLQAVKETFRPGPYAAYAQQLLGIKNVQSKAAVNWIIDEVKIEVFPEPDPEQVYKAMGSAASLINLSSDGCLTGVNSKDTDDKKEVTVTNKTGQKKNFEDRSFFEYYTDSPIYIAGDSTNNFRPVKLPDEQKISKAAQRVLECRRIQYEIAAGLVDELHPDGEAYKVSLKELKKIEEDYLSLFVGKTTYDKETFGFDYVPKTGGKSEAIFRISDENGIIPATDLSGKPVMIEFEIDKDLTQKYTGLIKSDNPAAGQSGIYYRIPGRATVRLINDMNVIATARATIPQFGAIAPMPEELLNGEYVIMINPETGAIKSIEKK